MIYYKEYTITHNITYPHNHKYEFIHKEYYGHEGIDDEGYPIKPDKRAGHANTIKECIEQIEELENN